jgi:hypothetical protein
MLDLSASALNAIIQASTVPNSLLGHNLLSRSFELIQSSTPVFSYHSFCPSSILLVLLHCTTMPGNSEGRYTRLEGESLHDLSYPFRDHHPLSTVISGKNIKVPSGRIPAGIYVSINFDSINRWRSTIGVLSSDESIAWADTVTLYKFIETFRHNSRTDLLFVDP